MQQAIAQVQQAMQLQPKQQQGTQGQLLLLQYKPVITYTRSGGKKHLLLSDSRLAQAQVDLIQTDRGGDVTFHGPGQLVGYPIVPIAHHHHFVAIGRYLHALQQALLAACSSMGVPHCTLMKGKTGVWVCTPSKQPAKLVAVGVGVNAHGISRHGFALNVCADLQQIKQCIVPCGLADTSLANLHEQLQQARQRLPSWRELCETVANSIGQQLQLQVRWRDDLF